LLNDIVSERRVTQNFFEKWFRLGCNMNTATGNFLSQWGISSLGVILNVHQQKKLNFCYSIVPLAQKARSAGVPPKNVKLPLNFAYYSAPFRAKAWNSPLIKRTVPFAQVAHKITKIILFLLMYAFGSVMSLTNKIFI